VASDFIWRGLCLIGTDRLGACNVKWYVDVATFVGAVPTCDHVTLVIDDCTRVTDPLTDAL